MTSDLIPQAIIGKPVSYFVERGYRFEREHDSLDDFEGASFVLDKMPFSLRHYPGYPPDTTTIYLSADFGYDNIERISQAIRKILQALEVSPDSLIWERKDNPEL